MTARAYRVGPKPAVVNHHTRASMIEGMKALALSLGHTPSRSELKTASPPSIVTWIKMFGSIRAAQDAAELPRNQSGRPAGPSRSCNQKESV